MNSKSKTPILFIKLLILLCISNLQSQPEPVNVEFVEAQPVWEHLVFDTNFYEIGVKPDINKYTVVTPHLCKRVGDRLVILNIGTNHNGRTYGYILEVINCYNGDVEWQSFSTYYNEGFQDYYHSITIRPDGNIELVGIKRHGSFTESGKLYWEFGGAKSNFVRKIFDISNGELINTYVSQDSISGVGPTNLRFFPIETDSLYIMAHQTGKQLQETVIYGYDFYGLDQFQNLVDSLSFSEVIYETLDSATISTYGSPPFIQVLNDTTLICLIFKDRYTPNNTEAQLIWIDITDVRNIFVKKRIQVEDLILGEAPGFIFFQFEVANKAIYFSQPYKLPQAQTYTTFLTYLHSDGEVVHFFPECFSDSYNYEFLYLIYASDEYDYFSAFPSRTGRKGFDLLKLTHENEEFEYISSLTSANIDEEFTRQMAVCRLYDDGKFIIGAYTKKLGEVQNSAVKYYCFDGKDLGLETITSIKEYSVQNDISVYPNPSDGLINFNFSNSKSGGIEIYNTAGQRAGYYKFVESLSFQVNMSAYMDGMYFAVISDSQSGLREVVRIVIF